MVTWCINLEKFLDGLIFLINLGKLSFVLKTNVMQEPACFVVDPIRLKNFAAFRLNEGSSLKTLKLVNGWCSMLLSLVRPTGVQLLISVAAAFQSWSCC